METPWIDHPTMETPWIDHRTTAASHAEIAIDATDMADMVLSVEDMDIKLLESVIRNTDSTDKVMDITDRRRALTEEIATILVMVERLNDSVLIAHRLEDFTDTLATTLLARLSEIVTDRMDSPLAETDMDSAATTPAATTTAVHTEQAIPLPTDIDRRISDFSINSKQFDSAFGFSTIPFLSYPVSLLNLLCYREINFSSA